jgi:hypothetical protein
MREPHALKVYNANGKYLQTIGRPGRGPTEFQNITGVFHLSYDTTFVFDSGNARVALVDSKFDIKRTQSLAVRVKHAVPTLTGNIVVSGRGRDKASAGFPLHTLRRDGSLLESYGAMQAVERPDVPAWNIRPLAKHRQAEGVWLGFRQQYVVQLWSGRKLEREYVRDAKWFRPWLWEKTGEAPKPILTGLHEDSRGYVWVYIAVPDPNWKKGLKRIRTFEGNALAVTDHNKVYDTIIEVIDPKANRVVLSQRVPSVIAGVLEDGRPYGAQIDDNGFHYITAWQARLIQR